MFPFIQTLFLCAQLTIQKDSLPIDTVYAVPIIVTANRLMDTKQSGVARTSIPFELTQRLLPRTLADILPLAPGVFLRDYGGVGGLKSVSVRGASAAQTLVLFDGIRLNSSQHGGADAGLIPATFIENTTVIRGGSSALYGANALSGVIDVELGLPHTSRIQAQTSLASFDEYRMSATLSTNSSFWRVGGSVEYLSAAGSFPFDTHSFGKTYSINRSNSQIEQTSLFLRAENPVVGNLTVIARIASRGVPGGVVQGNVAQARALLTDNDVVALYKLSWQMDAFGSQWLMRVLVGVRHLTQKYTDPDALFAGTAGINSTFITNDLTAAIETKTANEQWFQHYKIEAGFIDLRGNLLQANVGSYVRRGTIATMANIGYEFSEKLSANVAARLDILSDVGSAASTQVTLRSPLTEELTVRASLATGFRPPSFNELYYLNYGTASLKPETSLTPAIGVTLAPYNWLECAVDCYSSTTHNYILAIPVSPVLTTAQNIGTTQTYGAELSVRMVFADTSLMAQISSTLQTVTDQTNRPGLHGTVLPYVPPELHTIAVMYKYANVHVGTQWSYTSYRYAQAGAEYTSLLQPFTVGNMWVAVEAQKLHTHATIRFGIENILNETYTVIRAFPMPGRLFRLSIQASLQP